MYIYYELFMVLVFILINHVEQLYILLLLLCTWQSNEYRSLFQCLHISLGKHDTMFCIVLLRKLRSLL